MKELLKVSHVSKAYEGFSLSDISFTLPGGSIMGFVGENGAGKTTTLRLILNLIVPDEGEISVFGLDSRRDERQVKEDLGVVFDECSFHPGLTPVEVGGILRGLYRRWDTPLYRKMLRDWSIPEKKKVKDLSRGMKAKLSIAAALAHHPRLLLLDEATGGLDPVMRGEVLDTLQAFVEDEDHGVLLSSHITSDLDRIADYVTFLHEGKIVFCEEKDRLLETYGVARCPAAQADAIPPEWVLGARHGRFGSEVLVSDREAVRRMQPDLTIDRATLEEIMMLMCGRNEQ